MRTDKGMRAGHPFRAPRCAGVTIPSLPIRFPPSGLLAVVGLLLALLITAPASARMQCDCGNYLMSCMAGCLGNPYCTSRCQQFHDTCVSSCSGSYSGGDRHHRHDDDDEDRDDDRYPRHRHW
ncbi:hypothetical protein [Plasticicumulans sp.]|uniref:hypothetical protein n=1 Tax=Plasticicumulans sp. TaxID=2307179 RepID=UPI0039240267